MKEAFGLKSSGKFFNTSLEFSRPEGFSFEVSKRTADLFAPPSKLKKNTELSDDAERKEWAAYALPSALRENLSKCNDIDIKTQTNSAVIKVITFTVI